MKYLYTFLFTLAMTGFARAQCDMAVAHNIYTQHYGAIATQTNDQMKLDHAINFTANNCVSSAQVKTVALLFVSDEFRMDFCILSYINVVDKSEFYMVYDAFKTFSYAFRLHDFVLEQRQYELEAQNTDNSQNNNNNTTEPQLSFPNWNYPSVINYNGATGCASPIPDNELDVFATDILNYHSDQERMVAAAVIVHNHCLSMAQLMKLVSLFSMETNRLNFMKNNFQFIYDQGNYNSGTQCFQHAPYQNDWLAFCQGFFKPAEPVITCTVDDDRFKQMLTKIDNESFADSQMSVVKILSKDNCFSTEQVKRIMAEFSFPENKLDVAKLLYPTCTDRENYYLLKGSFSFSSYEKEFEDLLNGK